MKGYRKATGVYLELPDATPVGASLVEVALRPSPDHTFTAAWEANPLDPAGCWRLKTAAELQAEHDAAWQALLDSPAGRAVRTIALVGSDKTVWTLAELRAKYRTL